jgi:DHA1 family multidrug resistance protein-like MFS transporter
MLGMVGGGLAMISMGIATQFWVLFGARVAAGVLTAAALPTAAAYVSDITTEKERSGGMGAIGAAKGLGVILGPAFGGWLATYSLAMPFYTGAALALVSVVLIFFLLPESLTAEACQQSKTQARFWQFGEMRRAFFSPISTLLLLAFVLSAGLSNFEAIFGLYAVRKLAYTPQQVGMMTMIVGVVYLLGQGVLVGPLSKRWGEALVIKGTLLAAAVGFVWLVLAESYGGVLVATGFFVLARAILKPVVTALTSKRATVGQGMAMGLNDAAMSLGRVLGPVWAGFVFDLNVEYPYLTGAAIMFLGYLASLILLPSEQTDSGHRPVHQM